MRNNFITGITFCLLLLTANFAFGQEAKANKVLIIGIDGCRPDALLTANTPNMDALWKNGAYCFRAQTDEISSSGPAWTAMLTGVWHDKHNVLNNDYTDPDLNTYPHFFHRLREEKPELVCYSIANWGPVHKILQEGDATYSASAANDARVASRVSTILENEELDVMFVQLDEVDHAGHTHDYSVKSSKYLKAIEKSDRQAGEMVDAVKKRQTIDGENWLIIVSTDHGGSNFGHGKNIPEHTTIFYIASGEDAIAGEIEDEVGVVDVAVTALHHMGIPIEESWNLDGHVAGIK